MRTVASIAILLLSAAGVRGQVNVNQRLPDGRSVGTGQIEESPRKVRQRYRRKFEEYVEKAAEHVEKSEFGLAREDLRLAGAHTVDAEARTSVARLLGELDAKGQPLLEEALDLYEEQKFLEAIKRFERLNRQFVDLPTGHKARKALAVAERDPAARAALQEARASILDERIETILEGHFATLRRRTGAEATPRPDGRIEQVRSLKPADQLRVYRLLETCAKLYPESETGSAAGRTLAILRRDPAIRKAIQQARDARKIANLYNKAEAYRKAGLLAKALKFHEKLMEKHPDTDWATRSAKAAGRIRAELATKPQPQR